MAVAYPGIQQAPPFKRLTSDDRQSKTRRSTSASWGGELMKDLGEYFMSGHARKTASCGGFESR